MFMSELGRHGTIDLVAHRDGDVLGYIMVSRYADVWHILNVVVREAHRDQGIGGRLLDELFERASARPHLGFTLEVRVSNAPRHPPLPAQGLPRPRRPAPATTRTTARTR